MIAPRIVSATARRHGLSNSQLFTWRRQAREGKLVAAGTEVFVPAVVVSEGRKVDVATEPNTARASEDRTRAAGRMEIVLSGARRVIVGNDVDSAALRRVIDALEQR